MTQNTGRLNIEQILEKATDALDMLSTAEAQLMKDDLRLPQKKLIAKSTYRALAQIIPELDSLDIEEISKSGEENVPEILDLIDYIKDGFTKFESACIYYNNAESEGNLSADDLDGDLELTPEMINEQEDRIKAGLKKLISDIRKDNGSFDRIKIRKYAEDLFKTLPPEIKELLDKEGLTSLIEEVVDKFLTGNKVKLSSSNSNLNKEIEDALVELLLRISVYSAQKDIKYRPNYTKGSKGLKDSFDNPQNLLVNSSKWSKAGFSAEEIIRQGITIPSLWCSFMGFDYYLHMMSNTPNGERLLISAGGSALVSLTVLLFRNRFQELFVHKGRGLIEAIGKGIMQTGQDIASRNLGKNEKQRLEDENGSIISKKESGKIKKSAVVFFATLTVLAASFDIASVGSALFSGFYLPTETKRVSDKNIGDTQKFITEAAEQVKKIRETADIASSNITREVQSYSHKEGFTTESASGKAGKGPLYYFLASLYGISNGMSDQNSIKEGKSYLENMSRTGNSTAKELADSLLNILNNAELELRKIPDIATAQDKKGTNNKRDSIANEVQVIVDAALSKENQDIQSIEQLIDDLNKKTSDITFLEGLTRVFMPNDKTVENTTDIIKKIQGLMEKISDDLQKKLTATTKRHSEIYKKAYEEMLKLIQDPKYQSIYPHVQPNNKINLPSYNLTFEVPELKAELPRYVPITEMPQVIMQSDRAISGFLALLATIFGAIFLTHGNMLFIRSRKKAATKAREDSEEIDPILEEKIDIIAEILYNTLNLGPYSKLIKEKNVCITYIKEKLREHIKKRYEEKIKTITLRRRVFNIREANRHNFKAEAIQELFKDPQSVSRLLYEEILPEVSNLIFKRKPGENTTAKSMRNHTEDSNNKLLAEVEEKELKSLLLEPCEEVFQEFDSNPFDQDNLNTCLVKLADLEAKTNEYRQAGIYNKNTSLFIGILKIIFDLQDTIKTIKDILEIPLFKEEQGNKTEEWKKQEQSVLDEAEEKFKAKEKEFSSSPKVIELIALRRKDAAKRGKIVDQLGILPKEHGEQDQKLKEIMAKLNDIVIFVQEEVVDLETTNNELFTLSTAEEVLAECEKELLAVGKTKYNTDSIQKVKRLLEDKKLALKTRKGYLDEQKRAFKGDQQLEQNNNQLDDRKKTYDKWRDWTKKVIGEKSDQVKLELFLEMFDIFDISRENFDENKDLIEKQLTDAFKALGHFNGGKNTNRIEQIKKNMKEVWKLFLAYGETIKPELLRLPYNADADIVTPDETES